MAAAARKGKPLDLNGIEELVERPDRGRIATWRAGDAWLGGGTWLFSEPQPALTRLLDLQGFRWAPITVAADGVTLAATCRIADLERWAAPPDWRAAALVPLCCRALLGSFKVWNGATVGGNVCLALPAGPMTALATALDAACHVWGPTGERDCPVTEFVVGPGQNALHRGELLRSIRLPADALRRRAAFRQISLTPQGRSGALLIGTRDAAGVFRLTVTGAVVRPLLFTYPSPPDRDRVLGDLAALPDATIFDDVHGRPAWRRVVMAHLAGEIIDELSDP